MTTTTTVTLETPMYVGAPILLSSAPKDFDGRVFAFGEIQGVRISISKLVAGADPEPVIDDVEMTWSGAHETWEYVWDTADTPAGGAVAGNYRIRFEATDLVGLAWPEFIDKLKLTARRPMAPAGP